MTNDFTLQSTPAAAPWIHSIKSWIHWIAGMDEVKSLSYYNSTVIRAGIYLLSAIMKWEGIWTAIITPCHQLILIHQSLKKMSFLSMMRWIGLLNGPQQEKLNQFLEFSWNWWDFSWNE